MTVKIDTDTAITLREILLKDVPLTQAADDAAAALSAFGINPPVEASRRASDFLSSIPKVEDPEVADELLNFYNKVVDDGQYSVHMLGFPEEVAAKLGTPISSKAADFLKSIDPAKLIDPAGPDSGTEPPYTLGPDGLPLEWPRDQYGRIIITKIPRPTGPGWPHIDPAQDPRAMGWQSVVIAVAIGAILLGNKDDRISTPVLDRSGLERL